MKKLLFTIVLIPFLAAIAFSQFKKNDVELSFSGTIGSISLQETQKSGSYSSNYSDSKSYFYITVCPGFYVMDGFSLEPEIAILAVDKIKQSHYFLMNVSYTYVVPQSIIAPFVRAGYGLSNAVSLPDFLGGLMQISSNLDVKVLNLSGGIKFIVAKNASINAEINYRNHNYSKSSGSGNYPFSDEVTYSTAALLLGMSIIM